MHHSTFRSDSPTLLDGIGAQMPIPSGGGFIALLGAFRATGGTVPGDVMCRLLAEHKAGRTVSLAKLIYTGQAFGFEWRASLWIPMFQFYPDDLSLKAGAQRVRSVLPTRWPGWTLASWFTAPNAWLQGQSPVDTLDSDPDAVVLAAQHLQAMGRAAVPSILRMHEAAVAG